MLEAAKYCMSLRHIGSSRCLRFCHRLRFSVGAAFGFVFQQPFIAMRGLTVRSSLGYVLVTSFYDRE